MTRRLPPQVGDTFGGYTIESVLGRGGMGTVYLATHRRLERKAALKLITPALADDEAFRTRFLRESQLAASLDHPNVVPIYDAGEIDGVLYLAMRYVGGPSLQTLLRARGALSLQETLRLADQVGGALDAAHAAGLVHRDVKPANILVAEPGDRAYLCDFGLAKHTSSQAITQSGVFLGTVDYCAPEQIRGDAVDGRADLYSLGCVLFHCLAGEPPFQRESEVAVLEAHLRENPPALSSFRPELPRALDEVLRTAMAKDPDARQATGGELAAAMRRVLSGAHDDAPTLALDRPRRGRRWIAAAVVLALLAAGAIVGVLATHDSQGGPNPQLQTFVDRIENVLEQSAAGRRELGVALGAGVDCSITSREAAVRIASVADNRQSILLQLAHLDAPTQEADTVVTLLQRALQQSIEVDRHYRDAFVASEGAGCPPPDAPFAAARAADSKATTAKRRFAAAFNPLARRFQRRTWSPSEI